MKNKSPLCPRGRDKVLLKKEEGVMGECLCREFLQLYFSFPLNTKPPLAPTAPGCFACINQQNANRPVLIQKADQIRDDP